MERIASNTMSRRILFDNQRTLSQLADLQIQLSSGKRINAPSDDPAGLHQSMLLRASSSAIDSYRQNIERSVGFQMTTDSAFASAAEVLNEVRGFAVQGGNDTMTVEARRALAVSVDFALSQLVDIGNTSHDGRYVFAGTATTTKPFNLDVTRTSVTYEGTQDAFSVQISPTSSIEVSRDGSAIFQQGTDVFAVLTRLRDALNLNDGDVVRGLIDDVEQIHSQVNDAYGALGSQEKMLEMVANQIMAVQANLDEQASLIEDADLAKVITEFQSSQYALEAGLQAGAKVMQTSLLDFIR